MEEGGADLRKRNASGDPLAMRTEGENVRLKPCVNETLDHRQATALSCKKLGNPREK